MQDSRPKSAAQRFWSCVDKNGPTVRSELGQCWLWIGRRDSKGYGVFAGTLPDGTYERRASRFAYGLRYGAIPRHLQACHHCDNPPCVRPDHIFAGTSADNTHDAFRKGRRQYLNLKGENHGSAKLTNAQVVEIRARHANGTGTVRGMAREYGLRPPTIRDIIYHRTWRNLSA